MEYERVSDDALAGRTAVVTGGGGSIGAALSVRLARDGANVVVAQRSADSGAEVVDRIEELGGEAVYVETDLGEPADVRAVVEATVDRFGGVEIVVNNAANPKKEAAATMSTETWWDVLAVNLTAPYLLAREAYEYMDRAGYGRIVNVGAIQAYSPLPGAAAYSASKAGLEGLTRSLAVEWSNADLTVNTVKVGPVYGSGWTDDGGSDAPVERRYERVPAEVNEEAATLVDRIGRPSDVAALVSFLASPRSGYITGATIPCDGGRLVSRKSEPFDQLPHSRD